MVLCSRRCGALEVRVWLLCECVYLCHGITTVVTAGLILQLTLFLCTCSNEKQTLATVALHATTACTEDARLKYCWLRSTSLGYSQEVVICLVLHVSGSRYACIYARLQSNIDGSYVHTMHSLPTCNGRLRRGHYI